MNRVNAPPAQHATLRDVSIVATVGLMALTLLSAYVLWSLLLRAEQLYTRIEGHTQTAADIAGIAFLGIAAVIIFGAAAAFLLEARQLLRIVFI